MADLINADEAKSLLGCDDATLNNYVNNGTIRAQRTDGMLMLMREDVINLTGLSLSDSDDGTIILSGDSEDLSIDLGEVVDESSITFASDNSSDDQSDSITFGDELEVVSFEDDDASHTEELSFDDTDATQSLTFTDSNTAVVTDVDETVVGTATATATATSDFQTIDYGDDEDADEAMVTGASVRRSVRSQRVRSQRPKTSPIWPVLLILTIIVSGCFVYPYFYLMTWKQVGDTYYNGDTKHGVTDHTIWTALADSMVGFSTEPDRAVYLSQSDGEWRPINTADPRQADIWRYEQWRKDFKKEDRPATFEIQRIVYKDSLEDDDPSKRIPEQGVAVDSNGTEVLYRIVEDPNSVEGYKQYMVE